MWSMAEKDVPAKLTDRLDKYRVRYRKMDEGHSDGSSQQPSAAGTSSTLHPGTGERPAIGRDEHLLSERMSTISDDPVIDLTADDTGDHVEMEDIAPLPEDPDGPTFTVEDAVEHIGFGWFQIALYLNSGLLTVTDALEMMLLAVLSPSLRCHWQLEKVQVALITTVVFIGMFIGAPSYGFLSDKYGRRVIVLVSASSIAFYGLLTSFSPNYVWLLFLRGFVGLNIGGVTQAFTILVEYLPSKYRAKLLTIHGLFWAAGVMFEVLLASFVIPTLGWRWHVGLSALPIVVALAVFFFLPESARYLVGAGRKDEAMAILQRASKWNNKPLPPGRLIEGKMSGRGSVKDLLSPIHRRLSLQLWFSWFAAAFTYYGMVLAQASILEHHRECDPTKAAAVADVFDCKCYLLTWEEYLSMILASVGEFLALPFNLVLIDLVGRRITGGLNMLGSALFLLLLQVCTTNMGLTIFMFAARMFSTGFFNTIYIYTGEVYPTNIRSLGLGVASAMARIGSMTTPFIAQVLLDKSIPAAVWMYGVICVISSVNFFLLPIETKGRALKQSDT